ncbi:MAG: GlsB/YeaQ/YmgE family stress response membrane protein [Aristaeellaceae bacterium]
MMICPMCGRSFEGSASDILPGRELCEVCAENIRSYAKAQDEAERQAAHEYIRACQETTADPDVKKAIAALLREHEAPSLADDTAEPAAAAPSQADSMYGRSGPKIISAADILCVLGVLGSVVLGFLLIAAGANSRQGGFMVIMGFVVASLGSLVSWFVSLLARGFGEMVNNMRIQTELAVRNASHKE